MKIDIKRSIEVKKTFANEYIKSKFDLDKTHIEEHFVGDIDIENIDWNIGCIIGASGTGKTTIAKELFDVIDEFEYSDKTIIDELTQNNKLDEVVDLLNKVGFSSPPSWLKPYNVLSNGEKMRVNLAKAILQKKDIIVFDEFTSVVDRNVAKIGSYAVAKYIRKNQKKFVAVACHYDILEWLEPDWVFDTNTMTFYGGKVLPNTKDHQSTLKLGNVTEHIGKVLENIII